MNFGARACDALYRIAWAWEVPIALQIDRLAFHESVHFACSAFRSHLMVTLTVHSRGGFLVGQLGKHQSGQGFSKWQLNSTLRRVRPEQGQDSLLKRI